MAGQSFNPEIDMGLGKVSEVTKEQVEQFQEALKSAQSAMQKLQKDEKKAKKRDLALAALLVAFVKNNQDTDMVQLIASSLALNMPVNVILGILSLAYQEIYNELHIQLSPDHQHASHLTTSEKKLLHTVEKEEQKDLQPKAQFDEHNLPEHIKKRVNEWVKDILLVSLEQAPKMLETMYIEQNFTPHEIAAQLSTKCLERYLLSEHIEGSFSRLLAFSTFILRGIGNELQKTISKKTSS